MDDLRPSYHLFVHPEDFKANRGFLEATQAEFPGQLEVVEDKYVPKGRIYLARKGLLPEFTDGPADG